MENNNKKKQREKPEFPVQNVYEGQMKLDFRKMLVLMNKSVLQYILSDKDAVKS